MAIKLTTKIRQLVDGFKDQSDRSYIPVRDKWRKKSVEEAEKVYLKLKAIDIFVRTREQRLEMYWAWARMLGKI